MTNTDTRRIRPKQTLSNRLKKDEWTTVEDLLSKNCDTPLRSITYARH
jgi:hypothetical protein